MHQRIGVDQFDGTGGDIDKLLVGTERLARGVQSNGRMRLPPPNTL